MISKINIPAYELTCDGCGKKVEPNSSSEHELLIQASNKGWDWFTVDRTYHWCPNCEDSAKRLFEEFKKLNNKDLSL